MLRKAGLGRDSVKKKENKQADLQEHMVGAQRVIVLGQGFWEGNTQHLIKGLIGPPLVGFNGGLSS